MPGVGQVRFSSFLVRPLPGAEGNSGPKRPFELEFPRCFFGAHTIKLYNKGLRQVVNIFICFFLYSLFVNLEEYTLR